MATAKGGWGGPIEAAKEYQASQSGGAQALTPWDWKTTGDPNSLRYYNGSIDYTLNPQWGGEEWGGQPMKLFLTEQEVGGQKYNPGDTLYNDYANPYQTDAGTMDTRHTLSYQPDMDYGLGSGYVGVMPIAHNAQGQAVKFFALTEMGGGQVFDTAEEAKAARDKYVAWNAGQQAAASGQPATSTAPAAAPTVQTTGELAQPGYGETVFEDLSDSFYKAPTEQRTKWDQMKDQPTEQEQTWNKYEGVYANPGTEQSELYGNWESLFSDPTYLDDYYGREAQKAQMTLDRKAASRGWGGSSAAARATANIDRDFADRALLAKGQWAQTGMGLAGAADSSINAKATTGMGLAGMADKAGIDRFNMAGEVDTGELAKATSYGVAAQGAQAAKEKRLGGGLATQQGIADDMANLSGVFYSQAESQKFATDMAAIQVQFQQGNLSLSQAMIQAEEALAGMKVMNQAALNSYVMTKLLDKNKG